MSGAPPAAGAGAAVPPPMRQLGALPKPLLPAPGRPENVYVVSGFTEAQLSLLKRQARPRRRAHHGARAALALGRSSYCCCAAASPPRRGRRSGYT
jgi:hypothetical protein